MSTLSPLLPSYIAPSAWWEHVPIAHWLVGKLKPQTVVELGVHYGVSFFAFCQASKHYETDSFIYAVDTWSGDEHAGQYQDDVYNQVIAHQRTHYGQMSALLRHTFDEASAYFGASSIDLLHIDGFHTYEAVRHDHETWLPKLRKNATILYHDINIRERGFGVWRLWSEIKEDPRFCCLEVRNGSGLGMATMSEQPPAWHLEFEESRSFFKSVGALYLELAIRQLSFQQLQSEYSGLLAQGSTPAGLAETHLDDDTDRSRDGCGNDAHLARLEKPRLVHRLRTGRDWINKRKASLIDVLTLQIILIQRSLRSDRQRKQRMIKSRSRVQVSPKALRVILISGEPHTAGHRNRILHTADAYQAIGARVSILEAREIDGHLQDISHCDLLSLWRTAWSTSLETAITACRNNGGKVIFDVDDLIIKHEPDQKRPMKDNHNNQIHQLNITDIDVNIQRTMLASDVCITATHELARHLHLFGKPVMCIANGYDEDTFTTSRLAWRQRQQVSRSDVLGIGYFSSSQRHKGDFQNCAEALAAVLKRFPQCRLILFQETNETSYFEIHEYPVLLRFDQQIEWRLLESREHLARELAHCDINIVPFEVAHVLEESKREQIIVEAALAGCCSIASRTEPCRRMIRHGTSGFLASSAEEWEEYLCCLIAKPELRRQFAAAALADVLFSYSPLRRRQQINRLATYATNPILRPLIYQSMLQEEVKQKSRTDVDMPEYDLILHTDRLQKSAISVVIPLHNYSQYLEGALDSVKRQTLKQIDLIVIDDQSTDCSLALAKHWLERNHHYFNRTLLAQNRINAKLGPCRNVGFHLAESDYVFSLDADNELAPACLERCLDAARKSKAAFIYPTLQEFGHRCGRIGDADYCPIKLISGNYIDAMALVAKAAWLRVGGYRNIRHGWEDYDLWCRMAEMGLQAEHIPGEPLAYYRVHDQSMLHTTTDKRQNKMELIDHLESMHPWLHINRPPED